MEDRHKEWIAWAVLAVVLIVAGLSDAPVCRETYVRYGLVMETCHDGTIRQTATLSVGDVRRGATGRVAFNALAHYTVAAAADGVQTVVVPEVSALALTLVDDAGKARALAPVAGWTSYAGTQSGQLALPIDLPDGDYKLRADFETKIGKGTVDLPLALYTPARIHVITDRPLYEPGNTVKFRAVVLRARDLTPLDGRPGKWIVKDPSGEVLLEEKAPATAWGVVAGSFPLDRGAPTGAWTIAWQSGTAIDEVSIKVAPFTLPRFRIEATASKPYYRAFDVPEIKGAVRYSSNAPVANAAVELQWEVAGAWPPPVEWLDEALPKHATTGATGEFALTLPKVPGDLVGRVTLTARLAARDAAGDRVEGSLTILLSQDGLQVSAVTELDNGLVQGFNNRVYLRVTTPDGHVVDGAKIKVTRAWEASDPGLEATLDEDGVASLQLDPGAPVSIVIPALPYRPGKPAATVTRGEAAELILGDGAPLADQVEMDRWLATLAPCAKFFDGHDAVRVGLRVDRGGAIVAAIAGPDPLEQCTASVLRGRRLPAGADRMYTMSFTYIDPPLSTITSELESVLDAPEGLDAKIAAMARGARDCLPRDEHAGGALPSALLWRVAAKSKSVELAGWIADVKVDGGARGALACVQAHVAGRVELAEPAPADALGLVRFSIEPPTMPGEERPTATTMVGYELLVTAAIEGSPSTRLRVQPGAVPPLRLRVTPVVAKVGDAVTAELLRGPDYHGDLPKELELEHLHGKAKGVVDAEHKATFTIAPGTEGWVEIKGAGQRALVYVRPTAELAVAIKARSPVYKPGDQAELDITTLVGGKGGTAAVGLIGVDESLGQLVALPGADDLGRVRPTVETSAPAFDLLDGQALALGRIRGANAAAATVLRVTTIPPPPALDAVVTADATTQFDPLEELTDHFYTVLAELHVQARAWETAAPVAEKMHPATMARLWTAALDAVAARGEHPVDAYGRRLELRRLPDDLLSLTDPRAVIVVGTRLPEDVENWAGFVRHGRSQ
ncbi:MAG: MG2 domain-containing protein [Proteobacteria bacterium]|nr:MG2 domain-containing protein [Pseudomonadota bacterium]